MSVRQRNPDDLLIPNMMIDTSSWSSCSCQSPWLPCFGHTFSSTGPSVSPFRDFLLSFDKYFTQNGPHCSPEGRLCIDNSSNEDFGCQVSCEGLYADVTKHDVAQNEQYKKIKEEYLSYKRSYVKNIRFNGSAPWLYGNY